MFDRLGWCDVAILSSPAPASSATLLVSIAATIVALAGFWVAYNQMRIASAKVKLDLYNKRWGIYLAALDYYLSAYDKTEKSMEHNAIGFIKALRESIFLFESKDGITKTMESIKKRGEAILGRRQASEDNSWPVRYDEVAISLLSQKSAEALIGFEGDLLLLEQQIGKYINFKTVEGWVSSCRR